MEKDRRRQALDLTARTVVVASLALGEVQSVESTSPQNSFLPSSGIHRINFDGMPSEQAFKEKVVFLQNDGKIEQEQGELGAIPLENGVFIANNGQTQGFGIQGYFVENEIYEAIQARGGSGRWGKPISRRYIDEVGRRTQWYEKGGVQVWPDGRVEFVNIFDILGSQGKDPWLETVRQTPFAADWPSDQGKSWREIVENHFSILASYPQIQSFIFSNQEWLNMYGLPVSVKDYGPWISVRMQRVVLQLLKENFPYGRAGQVLVANGGAVAKEAGMIPEAALSPETMDNDWIYDSSGRPSRMETGRPSFYSRFDNVDEVAIRAPSQVNSRVLTIVKEAVAPMVNTLRPDIKERFYSQRPAISIFPIGSSFNSLPETWGVQPSPGRTVENMGGTVVYKPLNYNKNVAVVDERFFAVPEVGSTAVRHEFAHAIFLTFKLEDFKRWRQIFSNTVSAGKLYGDYCAQDTDACANEFWATVAGGFYFTRPDKLRQDNPEAFLFAQEIYGGVVGGK